MRKFILWMAVGAAVVCAAPQVFSGKPAVSISRGISRAVSSAVLQARDWYAFIAAHGLVHLEQGLRDDIEEEWHDLQEKIRNIEHVAEDVRRTDPTLASELLQLLAELRATQQELLAARRTDLREIQKQMLADIKHKKQLQMRDANQALISLLLQEANVHHRLAVNESELAVATAPKVVEGFFEAVRNDDLEAARRFVTPETRTELTTPRLQRLKGRLPQRDAGKLQQRRFDSTVLVVFESRQGGGQTGVTLRQTREGLLVDDINFGIEI